MIRVLILLLLTSSIPVFAQETGKWGDQGNGTYRNPIVAGDYSDPDVIRVGNDYYMISSTLQLSPGMVILHSKDLVNWETVSYAIDNLAEIGPEMNWDRMNRYNTGIYAGSIRHHKGKFYIHFTSFLEGFFVATADKITGPWKVEPMKDKNGKPLLVEKWDDPCPFWDDDGQAYMVASKPGSAWYCYLFKMSEDGTQLLDAAIDSMYFEVPKKRDAGTVIYPVRTAEGNKIIKKDGFYYLYHNEVRNGVRVAMMKRSKHIYGTKPDGTAGGPNDPGSYDTRQILFASAADREPNQGGLVNTPNGDWYFLTQVGKGGFPDGRTIHLLPVNWIDGFPYPGVYDEKIKMGRVQWQVAKPYPKTKAKFPQGSDEFKDKKLHPNWQWNYQPRADKWSLTARPGSLRLQAFKPIKGAQFFKAGNTLGQRYLRSDTFSVTVKIDISAMADGQDAGMTHFNGGKNYSNIGVLQNGGLKKLKYEEDSKAELGITLPVAIKDIWFRSSVSLAAINTYEYSLDGKQFIRFGQPYQLKWGNYRGDYVGMYTFNSTGAQGYIDVDWFHYDFKNK